MNPILNPKKMMGGIILDTGDDDLAAQSDPDAAVMQKAEDVFDAEEESSLNTKAMKMNMISLPWMIKKPWRILRPSP